MNLNLLNFLSWFVIAFFCGSLPFSVWIGQRLLKKDIRRYGDANPGATNVLRAGGRSAAVLALLLDFLKGALPVALAHFQANLTSWPLVGIALAPVLGHAFSPFLGFKGGKAVAVTGGIWCGLTVWEGPTVGGLLLGLFVLLLAVDGWTVIFAILGMLLYFILTPATWNGLAARPELSVILAVGVGNLLILAWKHRTDLMRPPLPRSWLMQRLHL
ncbi:MAG: glycerol-3-phosphate acyltransferase [Caldilineaceae bacterium]